MGFLALNEEEEGGSHTRARALNKRKIQKRNDEKVDGAICQLVSKLNDTMPMEARARL